jgi:hypothetical protein
MSDARPDALARLLARQDGYANAEIDAGVPAFMRRPDRWWETFTVRCVNGHVSRHVISTEVTGDMCQECFGACVLTFPEDEDGES